MKETFYHSTEKTCPDCNSPLWGNVTRGFWCIDAACIEETDKAEQSQRGKKGNLYELRTVSQVSPDVRIATLSNIYTRDEHFAIQGGIAETVYFRTNDPEKAVRMARRLALTCEAADHSGSAQHADHWQESCEPGPVRSLGAIAAAAIASAFGIGAAPEAWTPAPIRDIERDHSPKVWSEYCPAIRSPHSTHTGTR